MTSAGQEQAMARIDSGVPVPATAAIASASRLSTSNRSSERSSTSPINPPPPGAQEFLDEQRIAARPGAQLDRVHHPCLVGNLGADQLTHLLDVKPTEPHQTWTHAVACRAASSPTRCRGRSPVRRSTHHRLDGGRWPLDLKPGSATLHC